MVVVIETGEIDNKPQGWLSIRIRSIDELNKIADKFGTVILHDEAGPTELNAEYAVAHDHVLYYLEVPKKP